MMAFVRDVIAPLELFGSMHQVSRSISTNTGVAPMYFTALAVATHVISGTITSSPGPTPRAKSDRCRAAGATGSAQRKPGIHVLGKCLLKAVDIAGMIFIPAVLDGIEHVANFAIGDRWAGRENGFICHRTMIFIGETYRRRIMPQFGKSFHACL